MTGFRRKSLTNRHRMLHYPYSEYRWTSRRSCRRSGQRRRWSQVCLFLSRPQTSREGHSRIGTCWKRWCSLTAVRNSHGKSMLAHSGRANLDTWPGSGECSLCWTMISCYMKYWGLLIKLIISLIIGKINILFQSVFNQKWELCPSDSFQCNEERLLRF